MIEYGGAGARRVLLRQALGGDEFLRVTWHESKDVFVFSHWVGDTCTNATPVGVSELGDLASMTVAAIGRRASSIAPSVAAWPPPDPAGEIRLWAGDAG
ncbi:MAG: hypothetical protein ABJH68_06025 [Ilumatobacter sp.]|uniref:hypothetical protein n=1 Tax=Ilumatobacter sp. TaxID=1967498 RepID=UPI0032985FA9